MAPTQAVTVLEKWQISPAANTVPKTPIPLSFLDIIWFLASPMKRVLFYEFPHPPELFLQSILPNLKQSLSVTLQHFYPFTSHLFCPPPPQEPYFLHSDGDSVPFTVAESLADFNHLVGNHSRDVKLFHTLVPELPPRTLLADGTNVLPTMAIQVTLFPLTGICIGITFSHVAADGMAFNHFLKSWASLCKTKGNLSFIENFPPVHSRNEIQDLKGIKPVMLKQSWDWSSPSSEKEENPTHDIFAGKVRATFIITRAQIERLKRWILSRMVDKNEIKPLRISSFVVISSLTWVCTMRARRHSEAGAQDANTIKYFGFVADCRNRLGFPIPTTYFGNCLDLCVESATKGELLGENGIIVAAKAIRKEVEELEKGGALRRAANWHSMWKELAGHMTTVAGSPKLRVYETDFGWGRPKKSEVLHIDASGPIVLSDSGDEEGGIEVGLALDRDEMEAFKSAFEQELNRLMAI